MAETKKGASYIRKTLVANERVLYVGKLHNFAYVPPIVMLVVGMILVFLPILLHKEAEANAQNPENRMERIADTAASKIEEAKKFIPEEMLPYVEKMTTMRRVLLGLLLATFGGMRLLNTIIKKRTQEQAITNKKVIKKKGWVAVDTNELNLDRIESVKISQTAFDRMINRGRVLISGIGMEQIDMRGMKNPAELKKAILETIDLFVKK